MSVKEISVQDVYTSSSTQQEKLGTVGKTFDGKEYVYIGAGGTALDPGKVVANADETGNHVNIAVASAAAVGDTQVEVTLGATAATADQYAGGTLTVNDAAGEGITYRIAGHAAIASAGTGTIVLANETPIQVALTTASQVSLHNTYDNVVIAPADQADFAIGVPNVTIDADEYGWVQTRGICAVWADEAVAKGLEVTKGSSVAGAVEAADAAGEQVLGVAVQALVDTEYRPVYLTIT